MRDQDFSFSHPYFLLLLEIIPVMMLYYFRYYKKQRSIIQISTLSGFKDYKKTFRQKLIHIPFILRTLSIFSLIIAVAGPKTAKYSLVRDSGPEESVLLIDISQNVLARDFSPNRFESLKTSLDHFLDLHPGQSFGLVTMGKEVVTQVPITDDFQSLKKSLDEISAEHPVNINLEEGLKTAAENFQGSLSHHKQILLFLSSSPNTQNPYTFQAYKDRSDSISVYPMILASEGIASYPQFHNQDTSYIDRIIDIPQSSLMTLAQTTGGEFFRSRNDQELDKNFIKLTENLEMMKTKREPNYEGIFPFGWMAAILLILEILARYTILKSLP